MAKSDKTKKSEDREEHEGKEIIEKLVGLNRVTKVVKGGKIFKMSALVIAGDGNGRVGFGTGKAKEVPEAVSKAAGVAKSNMKRLPLREGRTLHHDVIGRYGSGKVILRSAPAGTGIIAGGPMRALFEALGIQDVVAKSVGSSNPHNMIRAAFDALGQVSSPRSVAQRRGKKVSEILGKKHAAEEAVAKE
ncbi:MAG: 30S ribosomal protein S5 [Alphaproteobacteria bacterium]|nr:30S ribosomal protein S5 [Alphaproteobacteria bacterium]